MKIKSFLLSTLSLSVLTGCVASNNPMVFEQTQIMSAQKDNNHIEDLVDQKRMQNYMAVFTGKSPFLNNSIISERGSLEGRNNTRTYLTNTLEALGYKIETQNYRKTGTNLMVKLMAEQPTDEYIMVGAHLDSVNNTGADDDGSGSTAVLEAATVLPNLTGRKINIIFAWFDEKELGLVGSKALAAEYKKQKLKINSVHAIDMMGWDKDGDRAVELARPDGVLWDYYKMVNEKHQLKLPLSRTNTGSSDHESFHNNGFNTICLSEEWNGGDTTPHYHKKTDTYETVNFDFLAAGTKLIVATVGDLSMKLQPPSNVRLVPHDQFPGIEKPFH